MKRKIFLILALYITLCPQFLNISAQNTNNEEEGMNSDIVTIEGEEREIIYVDHLTENTAKLVGPDDSIDGGALTRQAPVPVLLRTDVASVRNYFNYSIDGHFLNTAGQNTGTTQYLIVDPNDNIRKTYYLTDDIVYKAIYVRGGKSI